MIREVVEKRDANTRDRQEKRKCKKEDQTLKIKDKQTQICSQWRVDLSREEVDMKRRRHMCPLTIAAMSLLKTTDGQREQRERRELVACTSETEV